MPSIITTPPTIHPTPIDDRAPVADVGGVTGVTGTAGITPNRTTDAAAAAWSRFSDARVAAQIRSFSTPNLTAAGFIDFEWDQPGDTIPFEIGVLVQGDARNVKAELWTNANNNAEPGKFEPHLMQLVRTEGNLATFRIDLPITNIGNYRATARISTDSGQSFRWCDEAGVADLRFRPRDERHDARDFMEIHVGLVNHHRDAGTPGTFADLMASGSPETNGTYTLEWLRELGKTDVWIQPPFLRSKWQYRHWLDDAGSPYATKDYFRIDPEYARSAAGLYGEAALDAAMAEFKAFVDEAHSMGIRVHLDIALNHVGHNYEFRDLFVRYTDAGKRISEVRKDDYANVAIDAGHLAVIERRLADPRLPDYMEYVAPHMYGSKWRDKHGAQNVNDTTAGGWGEWSDTKQLNHGARWGFEGGGITPENQAVLDYITRVLEFWAVDMGIDGFRFDHLTGMGPSFLEGSLNRLQAAVDKNDPGRVLHLMGEDFNNVGFNIPFVDNMQGGWYHELVKVRTPDHLRWVLDNPHFQRNLINLDSHDEHRFINSWGGDWRGATRMAALLELVGGTVMHTAGSELGERQQMQFKQYKDLPSMRNVDHIKREIAETLKRSGRARARLAALQDDNRAWLWPRDGATDINILAMSRFPDRGEQGDLALVFANLANEHARENVFLLDAETKARLNPTQRYQVYDLMADDPRQPVWPEPITGRELMEKGVFVGLRPFQIQCLRLLPVR